MNPNAFLVAVRARWQVALVKKINVLVQVAVQQQEMSAPRMVLAGVLLATLDIFLNWANVLNIGARVKMAQVQPGQIAKRTIHRCAPLATAVSHWMGTCV